AHDDGVDVLMPQPGVGERAIDGPAAETRNAHVGPARLVMRLSAPDDGDRPLHVHLRSVPSTQRTFCWRQWPCAACAMARRVPGTVRSPARPESWRKTSPSRMRPVLITRLPHSPPPARLLPAPPPTPSPPTPPHHTH